MFIDKILARFKIQTKVLVFILPFVLSICAVGFTGLYASGLLQGRMEISNSVLQSLSGFKDVYAGMNRFLQNTSEESRDAVHERLKAQVRGLLGLPETAAIAVNEIICADPACPGSETVILVMKPGEKKEPSL